MYAMHFAVYVCEWVSLRAQIITLKKSNLSLRRKTFSSTLELIHLCLVISFSKLNNTHNLNEFNDNYSLAQYANSNVYGTQTHTYTGSEIEKETGTK